jgi:hypothetical protein
VTEPKPFLEHKLCGEWLALMGQFFWLSVLARGLAKETHVRCEHFTGTQFVLSQKEPKAPFG